jgi:5'(3')-deoxyribonucleotidase
LNFLLLLQKLLFFIKEFSHFSIEYFVKNATKDIEGKYSIYYVTMSDYYVGLQEKLEEEIRKISRLEGNKICVDCSEKVILILKME